MDYCDISFIGRFILTYLDIYISRLIYLDISSVCEGAAWLRVSGQGAAAAGDGGAVRSSGSRVRAFHRTTVQQREHQVT